MGEQDRSAERADSREHQAGGEGLYAASDHRPFEKRECGYQQSDYAMLQDIRRRKTFPEAVGSERPIFRVGAQEEKHRQAKKHQRPVSGPWKISGAVQEREQ